MDNKLVILHILFVSKNKSSGVRSVVPKHLEYQQEYAHVALLNCNDSDVDEAKGKFNVYNLNELKDRNINNLPEPFNKPDLVVFHSIYYPEYIALYKQFKKAQIPYVIVPHGSLTKQAQKQKRYKKIPANLLLFNGFIKSATAIQFLIDGEMEKSRKVNKYIISGNGIELSKNKKEYDSCNDKENAKENNRGNEVTRSFKYIYIGRFDTYTKGLDLLVKAVSLIRNEAEKYNLKFMLYGADYRGREKILRKLIQDNNLEKIITINGPVWDVEKEKALLDADVFLQVSRTEGQPTGLMQAIDYGIPCIVTNGTNYGKIVEKNILGWTAKETPESISEKILEAYNTQSLRNISENEKRYAIENFEWKKVAKDTILKYNELIKKEE